MINQLLSTILNGLSQIRLDDFEVEEGHSWRTQPFSREQDHYQLYDKVPTWTAFHEMTSSICYCWKLQSRTILWAAFRDPQILDHKTQEIPRFIPSDVRCIVQAHIRHIILTRSPAFSSRSRAFGSRSSAIQWQGRPDVDADKVSSPHLLLISFNSGKKLTLQVEPPLRKKGVWDCWWFRTPANKTHLRCFWNLGSDSEW